MNSATATLVTRIAATSNRKSLATAIATQKNHCDSENTSNTAISLRFLREKLATSKLWLAIASDLWLRWRGSLRPPQQGSIDASKGLDWTPDKVLDNPKRFYRTRLWPPKRFYRTTLKRSSESQTGLHRTFHVEAPPFLKISQESANRGFQTVARDSWRSRG